MQTVRSCNVGIKVLAIRFSVNLSDRKVANRKLFTLLHDWTTVHYWRTIGGTLPSWLRRSHGHIP